MEQGLVSQVNGCERGMKKKMPEWKQRLAVFEEIWFDMSRRIRAKLDAMSLTELRQLSIDLEKPSQTNCSWAMYEVCQRIGWDVRGRISDMEAKEKGADAP